MVECQERKRQRNQGRAKPVTLAPLTFEEALAGLLQSEPPKKEKATRKKPHPPKTKTAKR